MADKKLLGPCTCPICGHADAELWEGEKGKPYVKCDNCVGMCRAMSRMGCDKLRALLRRPAAPAASAVPAKAPEKKDAPAAPTKKNNSMGFA